MVAALDADDVAVASDIAKVIATNVAVVATDSINTIRHYHKGHYHNIFGSVGVQLLVSCGSALVQLWCDLIPVGG